MAAQLSSTFVSIHPRAGRGGRVVLSAGAPRGCRRISVRHHVAASKGFGDGRSKKEELKAPKRRLIDARKPLRTEDLAAQVASGLSGTNIYMVGMMGSGKSKVGEMLAQSLRYAFFDTDALVETASGASVSEVFATIGKDEFRKLETNVLRELHCYKNCVVSTGGGIVVERENWSYMQQGIVVWLNGSNKLLANRIMKGGVESRPLLADCENPDDVVEKLDGILLERIEYYKNADIVIPLDTPENKPSLSPTDVRNTILENLSSRMREAILEREAKKNFKIVDNGPIPGGNATDSSSTPVWKRLAELKDKDSKNSQLDPEE